MTNHSGIVDNSNFYEVALEAFEALEALEGTGRITTTSTKLSLSGNVIYGAVKRVSR